MGPRVRIRFPPAIDGDQRMISPFSGRARRTGPDGGAVVAIGTDTGGSVRIPAALCGVVGFKPTQKRIPRDGATPLSTTLDSIGPLANSVACCAAADAVMAGEPPIVPPPIPADGLRLGVPQSYVLDGLAAEVASAFADAWGSCRLRLPMKSTSPSQRRSPTLMPLCAGWTRDRPIWGRFGR